MHANQERSSQEKEHAADLMNACLGSKNMTLRIFLKAQSIQCI